MESSNIIKLMNQDFVRLDRFDGTNFTRWKDKLIFMLTALKIFYVLDPNLPSIPPAKDDDSTELKAQRQKRQEDEVMFMDAFLIRFRIDYMISTRWRLLLQKFGKL